MVGAKSIKITRMLALIIAIAFMFTMAGIATTSISSAATKAPTKITLKATSKVVDVKGKVTVSVKSVTPAKASKLVTWKSSNAKIAKVSTKGVVTGVKAGKVKITAVSKKNKKVKASISITVKDVKPTAIKLNKTKASLTAMGKQLTLKATLTPAYVYNKGITWKSSDPKVATVSSKGLVSPLREGTVKITATTKEGAKKATCTVTVAAPTNDDVLRGAVLIGYFSKSEMVDVKIGKTPIVDVYNKASGEYEPGTFNKATIVGNFVRFIDLNGNEKADLLQVVKYEDADAVWDNDAQWVDGAGAEADPVLTDEDAKAVFTGDAAVQRIPMGQRLLEEFGVGDFSGVNDFTNDDTEVYWNHHDWYHQKSGGSLILLEGFKTAMQPTSWSCVLNTTKMVLEWYGQRGILNEMDLAAIRSPHDELGFEDGSTQHQQVDVFNNLSKMGLTCEWKMESCFDNPDGLYDPEFIKGHLKAGHPIILNWNSWGSHSTVLIGYDDMGTESVSDDICVIADPYDTTDQLNDGYNIEPYERLAYGLSEEWEDDYAGVRYLVVYPKNDSDWAGYTPSTDGEVADREDNTFEGFTDQATVKLNDVLGEEIAADLHKYYLRYAEEGDDIWDWVAYDETTQVGGPLAYDLNDWEANYNHSPYYVFHDFYKGEDPNGKTISDTLHLIKNYRTIQQSTEWTCGCTASCMVINRFFKFVKDEGGTNFINNYNDVFLSTKRQDGEAGVTFVSGIEDIFKYVNHENNTELYVTFTNYDTEYDEEDEVHYLKSNDEYGLETNLVPYLIDHDIPIMIGWDEWGGHWQTIIGYDDMGTEGTQDDVIILADSYDTTDHYMDGYVVESFERLMYGWNAQFEAEDPGYKDAVSECAFVVAIPNYEGMYSRVIRDLGL